MINFFKQQHTIPLLVIVLLCHTPSIFAIEDTEESLAYVSLDSPLVVNIFSQDSVHFMQVNTDFQLKDASLAPIFELHMAAVKHSLMLLFSEKRFFEMKTIKGKLQLRKDALKAVQQVMLDKTGNTTVKNIFFTSLILQ
ncbi:hypothetical protein MNBD_GAMMA16-1644 [hydrothermal vent metagenome]|uniref:Flagellar protein FliL n=1 Tax=hydrothermal vent metagenome TaxID=652676 RepID=A0A3B0YWG1_9ZZZZ